MRPDRRSPPVGAGEISPLAQKRCSQRTALAMLTPKRLAAALRDRPPWTTASTTRSRRSSDSAIPAASFARRESSITTQPIRESSLDSARSDTALVVVGDLIGSGEAQERGIVGETPNLAARLQGIAEPNAVVIAESTRRLLGNLFELEDLGAKDLKGIAGPVKAWAALRPAAVEGRFEALHGTGLTDLVGREEELELLLRRWSRAKNGEGQVVLLSGEAGIGKSRLTAAL